MGDSIFNEDIKIIAKKLVVVSNKNIKQTEALDLLAKMDGYNSYNEDYRVFANANKNIEKELNKHIVKLRKKWEQIKNINFKEYPGGEVYNYCFYLCNILENFFMFKDDTYLEVLSSYRNMEVLKRLLDIDIKETDTEYSEEVIQNLEEQNLIQKVDYTNALGNVLYHVNTMHPKKFIIWFKNYFNLKYRFFNEHYYFENFMQPINSNIEIKNSKLIFIPFENTNMLNKGFIEDLLVKTGFYLIDIDYIIPNINIQIRLSYSFCEKDLIEQLYHFNLEEAENFSNMNKYIIHKLNEKSDYVDTAIDIFDSCLEKNAFTLYLEGIQVKDINKTFDYSIIDFMNEKENDFYSYLDNVNMRENFISPISPFILFSENENLLNILKANDFKKYSTINTNILNYDYENDIEKIGNYYDHDFNHSKDITYGVYKYFFNTLDESLIYIMNKNLKEVLAEVFVDLINRKSKKNLY